MQITSRFSIAVHVLTCVGEFLGERRATSEFLAGSVNTNPVVIRRILGQLKAAGLVTVDRGTGGVAPTRPFSEITLLDVFRAVEPLENGRLFSVHANPNADCPVGRNIHRVLAPVLGEAQAALEKSLESHTLADVIRETDKLARPDEHLKASPSNAENRRPLP